MRNLSNHLRRRREKVFQNYETRVPLDREAKVRIMHLARCLKHRTEKGRHYGALTGKFVDVLHALLWLIHDGKSGQCNPAYETIADKAGCCLKTVYTAILALERVGILSWVNRITRIGVRERDLFGHWVASRRVVRTSNAYVFRDPGAAVSRGNASNRKLYSGPPETSFNKEPGGGARIGGAPVIGIGETSEAHMIRSGWYHSGGKERRHA